MATIRSYTTIEQSKVLAKFLPLESADMYYMNDTKHVLVIPNYKTDFFHLQEDDVPYWSLAALLNVLPYPSLHKTFSGWRCDSYNEEGTTCKLGEPSDNQVDTCVGLILKLHELKML